MDAGFKILSPHFSPDWGALACPLFPQGILLNRTNQQDCWFARLKTARRVRYMDVPNEIRSVFRAFVKCLVKTNCCAILCMDALMPRRHESREAISSTGEKCGLVRDYFCRRAKARSAFSSPWSTAIWYHFFADEMLRVMPLPFA